MVEVVRTIFAPIFSDFENFSGISASIVAPPSDDFQICSTHMKGIFSPEKMLQTPSKLGYKYQCNLSLK